MTTSVHLPFLPVSAAILAEAPFFLSNDARMVRAGFWMMERAWHSEHPGSIPGSFEALSIVTRLSSAEVEEHYALLTTGWELQHDGRLHHLQLQEILESVQQRFGPELSVIRDSALLACQGGSAPFELLPPVEVVKKKRGKHALPKDFEMEKTTLERSLAEGYVPGEQQSWLVEQFRDYAAANDVRQANWQATMRNFMCNTYTRDKYKSRFGYYPGQAPSVELTLVGSHSGTGFRSASQSATEKLRDRIGRPSNFSAPTVQTFAQRAAARNSDLMAGAAERLYDRFSSGSDQGDSCGMGV